MENGSRSAAKETMVRGSERVIGDTGVGVVIAMPTGIVALAVGARVVLFGAIAL
jgi:hypothetical protein